MTWNAAGILTFGTEFALVNLLQSNGVDVMAISEAKIPASAVEFAVDGYVTFYPMTPASEKTRVIVLVKNSVAVESNVRARLDIMATSSASIWLEFEAVPPWRKLLVGATYRVWSNLTMERANLADLTDQLMIANDSKGDTVMLGDINLDVSRFGNILYGRRALLDAC
jgi:hypothetical protein